MWNSRSEPSTLVGNFNLKEQYMMIMDSSLVVGFVCLLCYVLCSSQTRNLKSGAKTKSKVCDAGGLMYSCELFIA